MIKVETIKNNQYKLTNGNEIYFQSYDTLICGINLTDKKIFINKDAWFSNTTCKYLKQFVNSNMPFDYEMFKQIKSKTQKTYNDFIISYDMKSL